MSGVNRKVLDFDFEKICSVTLSTANVYVCLACGKYFQGRGEGTPAYMHALHHEEHRLYMSLTTLKVRVDVSEAMFGLAVVIHALFPKKVYILPDSVEFVDTKGELNDIRVSTIGGNSLYSVFNNAILRPPSCRPSFLPFSLPKF